MFNQISTIRLHNYIYNLIKNDRINGSSKEIGSMKITTPVRISGGISSAVYAFSLIFSGNNFKKLDFVLKVYDRDQSFKCHKEGMILKALYHINFPVPRIYAIETSNDFLDVPFILLERVNGIPLGKYLRRFPIKDTLDVIKRFAETLAFLHSIKWEDLQLNFLKQPANEYDYASHQAFTAKILQKNLKVSLNLNSIIEWIEINAKNYPCNQYSIVHGDMHLDNFLVTKDRIVVIDWENPEIGDPMKNVALAYNNLVFAFGAQKYDKGKTLADIFVNEYAKKVKGSFEYSTFRFYIISSALIEAICYKFDCKHFLNPLVSFQKLGIKHFFAFPFVAWYFWWRSKVLENMIWKEIRIERNSTIFK